jgi:hypothetical protein
MNNIRDEGIQTDTIQGWPQSVETVSPLEECSDALLSDYSKYPTGTWDYRNPVNWTIVP